MRFIRYSKSWINGKEYVAIYQNLHTNRYNFIHFNVIINIEKYIKERTF
jgi:hypothetical protein